MMFGSDLLNIWKSHRKSHILVKMSGEPASYDLPLSRYVFFGVLINKKSVKSVFSAWWVFFSSKTIIFGFDQSNIVPCIPLGYALELLLTLPHYHRGLRLSLKSFIKISPWQGAGLHQHHSSLPSNSITALKRSWFLLIWSSYLFRHLSRKVLFLFLLTPNGFPHLEPTAPST